MLILIMVKKYLSRWLILMAGIITVPAFGQTPQFTRQDSLRGSITPERVWWDLQYYHLDISVDPNTRSLEGRNLIRYKVLQPHDVLQVDLQPPLKISRVTQNGQDLRINSEGNAHFIQLTQKQKQGDTYDIEVHYSGVPKEAVRPPWDGGITWQQDDNGLPFIASSCQGIGASIWWPCKDHMYDEPDEGMLMSVNVPENLVNVSNGRLRNVEDKSDGTKTYHWIVTNPINNYGVNINIGDYVNFSEKFKGEKGTLDMDYYVLRSNLEKAREQFKDVKRTMEAFEYWFGPYPFYEDSYKLVEAPYLGMEHQSSVTYGNGYQNGYSGTDLSDTGWGLKFDFIIVHETGHEWFANSITDKDAADMWIHESFTNYSENLFVEHHFGKQAGHEYVRGTRKRIANDVPIIGYYGVNKRGSGDMYYKGGNMLHTLRQIVNDDDKWRQMLRGLNKEFYHQTVTTEQIEGYMAEILGLELSYFFDQYLRTVRIPTLEYEVKSGQFSFRWNNCVEGFKMPLRVYLNGKETWLNPTTEWSQMEIEGSELALRIDPNFYISSLSILGD